MNNVTVGAPEPGLGSGGAHKCRRQSVIDAARELFLVNGYHGASMDKIAIRAGISKPILYNHFSGKLDLYSAVLKQYLDDMVDGLRGALADTAGGHSSVRGAIALFFDIADADGTGAHDLVFSSSIPNEPRVERRIKQCTAELATLVRERLCEHGMESIRADLVAFGLVGAAQLTSRQWRDSGHLLPKQEAIDLATDLWWGGLSGIGSVR